MSSIPFAKVQGLGNDFVVIDLRDGQVARDLTPSPLDPEVVRAICDRHFGVGADGVLGILPSARGDARMRVMNSDGSEAEMCGNGLRCVAKVLYETDANLRRPALRIETGAGLLECGIDAQSGRASTISVAMGKPRLTRGEIPMTGPPGERAVREPIEAKGRSFLFTAVSMGNPHAIIFIDDEREDLRALAETYGPTIETSPTFPRRTNVEFARVRRNGVGGEIDLVVWERGAGLTLACGTGACATAVAAWLEGRLGAEREVPVHLPGGTLYITVPLEGGASAPTASGVLMRGPAVTVFEAQLDPAALAAVGRRVRASV